MKTPIEFLQINLIKMHLNLPEKSCAQLILFLKLLLKWNKSYNLTAITDFDKMLTYHLLDSLSIANYLNGENIIDVGSGAGLPGIPLSIYFPEKQFTLIDSVGKKTRFLNQVVRELQLKNVTIINARAETYQPNICFDIMTARAVGSLDYLIDLAKHLLQKQGKLLAMKSENLTENVPENAKIISLQVPGMTALRSLVIIETKRS